MVGQGDPQLRVHPGVPALIFGAERRRDQPSQAPDGGRPDRAHGQARDRHRRHPRRAHRDSQEQELHRDAGWGQTRAGKGRMKFMIFLRQI